MTSELTAKYLGMTLKSPVIVGSCPLTIQPETVRQLALAGAGAIVLPSLLQEQIVHAKLKHTDPLGAMSTSGYQPQQDRYNGGVENYLATIRELKRREQIPIFASINGASTGDWIDFAKEIQASGADALEVNWSPIIARPEDSAEQIEQHLVDVVQRVLDNVSIPVAVKLSPHFTNLASIAHKIQDVGADGLILFTHLPEWDVCIDRMLWTIRWELSSIKSLGGILEGIVRVRAGGLDLSVAASGGVRTAEDALKAMIAGADVVMVTSEVYRNGPEVVRRIVDGVSHFLDASKFGSLLEFQQMRPGVEIRDQRLMRLEYVDPLTRSDQYFDSTPVLAEETGSYSRHKSS